MRLTEFMLRFTILLFISTILVVFVFGERLPIVGEDINNWGTILNQYLLLEHTINGTHGNVTAENVNISLNLRVNTSVLFVDSSAEKIGIKTATPQTTLDVQGNTSINNFLNVSSDTNGTITTTYIELTEANPPTTPPTDKLKLYLFDRNGFSNLRMIDNTSFITELGRDNIFIARNTEGVQINKSQTVYVSGSTGNIPNVKLARSDTEDTMPALGLASEDIKNNAFGRIIVLGRLDNVNTNAFSEGDRLFVSPTTAGGVVNTRPEHPAIRQSVGIVLNSGIENGAINVDTQATIGVGNGTISNNYAIGDGTAVTRTIRFFGTTNATISASGTNIGINTTSPSHALTVVGTANITESIFIGNGTFTCDASNEGRIFFNTSGKQFLGCNGTGFALLG